MKNLFNKVVTVAFKTFNAVITVIAIAMFVATIKEIF